eukprot:SM000006S19398  [mRNA]  locus=s6:532679:533824:+ [translate_table: standard]
MARHAVALLVLAALAAFGAGTADAQATIQWKLGLSKTDFSRTIKAGQSVTWTLVAVAKSFVTTERSREVRMKGEGGEASDYEYLSRKQSYTGAGGGSNFVIKSGFKYTHVFKTAGSYPYQCYIHTTKMTGVITVSGVASKKSPPPKKGVKTPPKKSPSKKPPPRKGKKGTKHL